jgi:hypothetical protein
MSKYLMGLILLVSLTILAIYVNAEQYYIENLENDISNFKPGDINNWVDVQYHDDPSTFESKDDKSTYVYDKRVGRIVEMEKPKGIATSAIYYRPDQYVYGAMTYVPTYEDSIYLSKNASFNYAERNTSSDLGGLCNYHKNDTDALENACNKLEPTVCASTTCCALLGGSKCVSGDEKGPTIKANYGDTSLQNRDYFYYRGKCYGNCKDR